MTLPTRDIDAVGGAGLAWPSPPVEAPYSLRKVMRPFNLVSESDRGEDGIPIAVKLRDGTATHGGQLAVCDALDDDSLTPEDTSDGWDFQRAMAYVFIECNWGSEATFAQVWKPRVVAKMRAASITYLARRLWLDEINAGGDYENPSLMSAADDISSGVVHPLTAMALLMDAYLSSTDTPGDAILHVPWVYAPTLWAGGGIHVVNGRVAGPLDIPISFGPYPSNIGPNGVGSPPQPYMAISGPIFAEDSATPLDPADPDGTLEAAGSFVEGHHQARRNTKGVIAEVANIFAFDTTTVFACSAFVPSPDNGNTE